LQRRDGSIEQALVHLNLRDDYGGLRPVEARQLASALAEAADEADTWGGHPVTVSGMTAAGFGEQHGSQTCVSWEWPIVVRCRETVVLTAEERRWIDNMVGGEYPSQETGRCAIAAGHRGPHHAVAQNVGDGHETWLVWGGGTGLREFRRLANCTLEIPLARTMLEATSTCMLFEGHQGPHAMPDPQFWWWGEGDLSEPAKGVRHAAASLRTITETIHVGRQR
jgi:hypothetical protein